MEKILRKLRKYDGKLEVIGCCLQVLVQDYLDRVVEPDLPGLVEVAGLDRLF